VCVCVVCVCVSVCVLQGQYRQGQRYNVRVMYEF